jgi:tetratricopeptide (TPR) repeat protein
MITKLRYASRIMFHYNTRVVYGDIARLNCAFRSMSSSEPGPSHERVPLKINVTHTINSGRAPPSVSVPNESNVSTAEQTIFDEEREMFQIRRKMTAAHSIGRFHQALEYAEDLRDRAAKLMGRKNTVYGSCLNNIALMVRCFCSSSDLFVFILIVSIVVQQKLIGEQEKARDTYTEAIHVYLDVTGKQHESYAAALSNLGVLYKEMSRGVYSRGPAKDEEEGQEEGQESRSSGGGAGGGVAALGPISFRPVKGMEKEQLLELSEQALVEALDIRKSVLGAPN